MKTPITILTKAEISRRGFHGSLLQGCALGNEMGGVYTRFRDSCGSPFFCLEQAMPLTPYLITCRHPAIPGQVLLFAARTGAIILLAEKVFAALQRGQAAEADIALLTGMGFLVADADTERRQVLHYMDDINRLNPNLTLAVVLGMECNFACRYCFEGGQKGGKAMDDATADQLVTFIQTAVRAEQKKLLLQICGGEPLLYRKRLLTGPATQTLCRGA
jgi:uncharacterized protein